MRTEVHETYQLATHWLPYLINNDGSGLTPAEQGQFDRWILDQKLPRGHFHCTIETDFRRDEISGLMAECSECTYWRVLD